MFLNSKSREFCIGLWLKVAASLHNDKGMEAVIFDFDGLIVDTESPEVEVWRNIFKQYGAELPDSWWNHAIGRGQDQQNAHPADLLIEQTGLKLNRDDLIKEGHQKRIDIISQLPLLPGVLDRLNEAEMLGLKLGIASSSRHQWVDSLLDKHHLKSRFESIVCADDVSETKPAPELYLTVCKKLNVSPRNSIALEDSPPGIRSAKAAGLIAIAIPNPFTSRLDLSEADAKYFSLENFTIQDLSRFFK